MSEVGQGDSVKDLAGIWGDMTVPEIFQVIADDIAARDADKSQAVLWDEVRAGANVEDIVYRGTEYGPAKDAGTKNEAAIEAIRDYMADDTTDDLRTSIADLWTAHRALLRRVEAMEGGDAVAAGPETGGEVRWIGRWDTTAGDYVATYPAASQVTYTEPGWHTVTATLGQGHDSNGDGA